MEGCDGLHEAWRLYLRNWVPLALMAQLLAFSVATSNFSLQIDSVFCGVVLTAASFAVAGRYLISSKWGSRLGMILLFCAQIQVMLLLGTPLSYVAASINLPLQDATLAHYDQLLGLDWPAYYEFFMQRPALIPYAYIGYAMIGLLTIPIPLVLGFTRHYVRLQNFTLACILAVCATTIISALLPAIGTYQQYGLAAESLNSRRAAISFNFTNYRLSAMAHCAPSLLPTSVALLRFRAFTPLPQSSNCGRFGGCGGCVPSA